MEAEVALHTFGWAPRSAMEANHEPRVSAVKFGDGYEQRSPDGVNHRLAKYRVEFRGTKDRITAIHNFLFDHGAVRAFLWTPPDAWLQGRYVCRKWSRKSYNTYAEISAEFDEVVV
ncbi:phage tail protein [Plesiomonas shigelloides]|nr:phage tail protein [Plesiomonas shigelloides]